MQPILNQKTEGTTEANTNILLTAIFNLSKNQDRLDFFFCDITVIKSPLSKPSPQIKLSIWAHLLE